MGLTGKALSITFEAILFATRQGVPTDPQKHRGSIVCSRRQQMRPMFTVNIDPFISLELLLKNLLYVRPIKVLRDATRTCFRRLRELRDKDQARELPLIEG